MLKVTKISILCLAVVTALFLIVASSDVYADCQCGEGYRCKGSCMGYTCQGGCEPKPNNCTPCSNSCAGCACQCDGSCGDETCDDGDNPPPPTATPAPWKVQGIRVRLSDFGDNAAIASQPVTVSKTSDLQLSSSSSDSLFGIEYLSKPVVNQPPTPAYTVGETILNNTYTASVSVPANWDVFSTWCKNKIDCHTVSSPRTGNPVDLDLGREGGYADLHWHFVSPANNLKALCNKYGTQATLSWNGPADIASYPIRVDRTENPNTPFVCDPNSTGPTNVCRDISGTSTTVNVDTRTNYGWWLHTGNYWKALAGSNFKCDPAPAAHVVIQAPNCPRYPGEYSWETPIEFDGHASSASGVAESTIFITKKCGNVLCEYEPAFPSNWCESAGGTMQYSIAGGTRGSFCRIKTATFGGADWRDQIYEASWKPNETGTYFAVINAKSNNPADFLCSGNPRCEYSKSSLDKYGGTACESGRFAACQLGGEEGKVGRPLYESGNGANLWGESIEFSVRSTDQCIVPKMDITVKNKEGNPATVPYQAFNYDCHPTYALCFTGAPAQNLSSSSPQSIATWPGGAGIVLASNQVLLGISPVPAGGYANTVQGNRAAPAPVYERPATTWRNYWWNPYPDTPLRSVNFVVATHTPTPTNTPTPTTVPQLKVTGVIMQRTGNVDRAVNTTFQLPFVSGISTDNKTRWTITGVAGCATNTPVNYPAVYGGNKASYLVTYSFPPHSGSGYCVPQVVNASGFDLPVKVTVNTSGMPSSYTLINSLYDTNVTSINPKILDIPIRYTGGAWIKLQDTSLTRPVGAALTNNMPYILDKLSPSDATELLYGGMISGSGGFAPVGTALEPLGIVSANNWKLPAGYTFNTSGMTSTINKFVSQIMRTQGFQKVAAAAAGTLTLSPGSINVIQPGSSVGQVNISGGVGSAVLIASSDAGVIGDISITTGTSTGTLLVIANNINIGSNVVAINGIYVAKDKMNLSGGGNTLKIKGNVVTGGGMINLRSRSDADHAKPSMFIQFDYGMYQKLLDIIGIVGSGS